MVNFKVDLSGCTAIVTGAGAGTGQAVALALAKAGAAVMVNDMNPDRADTVAAQITSAGGKAAAFQADVSNRFQAAALIETARDHFGKIDILVNAAGAFRAEPFVNIDEWDWRRQVDVNLTGTFFCCQLIGRVMSDEGGGCIVNLSSTAGYSQTLPQGAAYSASKAGVVALTQQSARELAPHQIRVNVICHANISEPDMPPIENPSNMLARAGTPEEVADVVLFLCSDAARFMTGQVVVVDGGA